MSSFLFDSMQFRTAAIVAHAAPLRATFVRGSTFARVVRHAENLAKEMPAIDPARCASERTGSYLELPAEVATRPGAPSRALAAQLTACR